jgi:hypothetical protein
MDGIPCGIVIPQLFEHQGLTFSTGSGDCSSDLETEELLVSGYVFVEDFFFSWLSTEVSQ